MTPTSAPPNGPAAQATPPRKVANLLEELTRLLQAPLAPAEFHAEFLARVLSALRGVAGAIWARSPQGHFQLQYQINLAEIGLDKIAGAQPCRHELLRQAAGRDEPSWTPPHSGPDRNDGNTAAANLTSYGLLLAPILVDGEVAGLIEVWQDHYQESQAWRPAARFLAEVAGFAAAYLHKNRLHHLQEQQQLWARLEAFTRRLHASLDPRAVAFIAANEGRLLLGCDQVSVALRVGTTVRVEAVSGTPQVEPRSRLVRLMHGLFETTLAWGERLVYHGVRDDSLPPSVLAALDAYLAESKSTLLVLLPLRDERDGDGGRCRSALLAESFGQTTPREQLEQRLTALAPHAAAALFNAAEHTRFPLGRAGRALAAAHDWVWRRGLVKVGLAFALCLSVAAALVLIPAPLRLDAKGQLLPCERNIVFAPITGKVVDMKAANGDRVERGQELLLLEDLETQLKVEQLGIKISAAEHRLAVINDQLAKAAGDDERDPLVKERIAQQYELRKAAAERAILAQGSRNPRRTPVLAPLAGKVVTFDAREQLVGKTVKPGDPLLRVASTQGAWELELHIPEGHVGQIREGLARSPNGAVDVDLLLTSQPYRTYKGKLYRDDLGGETTVKNNTVVLPARARVEDPELLAQLPGMPVGVEVRAKVHCGNRPLGFVWFFDLLEFFFEHVCF